MVIQRKGNAAAVSMSPLHELDKALELLGFYYFINIHKLERV